MQQLLQKVTLAAGRGSGGPIIIKRRLNDGYCEINPSDFPYSGRRVLGRQ